MKLQDLVCDLEYAKKLKKIDIKQESLFSFTTYSKDFNEDYNISVVESKILETSAGISTFTTEELLEILPKYLIIGGFECELKITAFKYVGYVKRVLKDKLVIGCEDDKLSNALAKLLIWCSIDKE